MHIIMGATGRVGSAVVAELLENEQAVKGVTRDEYRAKALRDKGAVPVIADAQNVRALAEGFKRGHTLFAITPETGKDENVIEEGKSLLNCYHQAIVNSDIKAVVGLSSIGAQHEKGTGNLQISHLLENTFNDLAIQKVFIRPAYYYSNWINYLEVAKSTGVLPSFFPPDFELAMVAPEDVGKFAAQVLTDLPDENTIYELEGPRMYTPQAVAHVLSAVLDRDVKVQQIERAEWENVLRDAGFSPDGVKNFVEMTQAVLDGKTRPEQKGTIKIKADTTLEDYFEKLVKNKREKISQVTR
ncbi:NmrA family NAD(P)-binding protein [Pseudochryseolinea flava]|uniref:Nucleoside-diphosphate sugar epimerase n=1 Tax=Pseudochryseolinea flava TaxID=2059302 RepID=A0A364XYD1_9BACT|nr:NmrA family NAD(P)-binding protein [Pseudochryseolinea flava]RAV99509.1 nucleoside-diphosphate sugar epimerase [Pseudochryseolinea flava]